MKKVMLLILCVHLFILAFPITAFAWSNNYSGNYINAYSAIIPTTISSGSPDLDVYKSASLKSGKDPNNICTSIEGTPLFRSTSFPVYGTIGNNFGPSWNIWESHSSNDSWSSSPAGGDAVIDTSNNGSIFQELYLDWNSFNTNRSIYVTITHAITYYDSGQCRTESFDDQVLVSS